ncbi:hypothetical protein Bhyg_03570, partial [Pseudolycoriella hygida]
QQGEKKFLAKIHFVIVVLRDNKHINFTTSVCINGLSDNFHISLVQINFALERINYAIAIPQSVSCTCTEIVGLVCTEFHDCLNKTFRQLYELKWDCLKRLQRRNIH